MRTGEVKKPPEIDGLWLGKHLADSESDPCQVYVLVECVCDEFEGQERGLADSIFEVFGSLVVKAGGRVEGGQMMLFGCLEKQCGC